MVDTRSGLAHLDRVARSRGLRASPAATFAPQCPDAAWLAGIHAEHEAAVHLAASRTAGPDLAGDITQEVFLRLWRRPDRFDPTRGSMRTFLLMITHGVAVDHLRSDTSRRARELRATRDEDTYVELEPDAQLIADGAASGIADALARLSDDVREAIVAAFYGGLTYRQVAAALGQPEGTIKGRIRRGLIELRKDLANTSSVPGGS